jgi:hypothetical protein
MRDLSSGEITLKDFRMVIYIVTLSKSSIGIFAIVMSSYYLNGFSYETFSVSSKLFLVGFEMSFSHSIADTQELIEEKL